MGLCCGKNPSYTELRHYEVSVGRKILVTGGNSGIGLALCQ
jgi:NADPH:quinone reductase-like Zn-dependent oxidoreductase